ncbi:MAG: hypothetical protein QOK29_4539 [Rhodospirillaceae bacterium]|jgi:hypothetical protein|nr:hypothetical protein [Rhodospirillaceae bacterium]
MATALIIGLKKCGKAITRDRGADKPGSKGEHVGVVVLAGEARSGLILTDSGTDVAVSVGSDADADAGAADHDAAMCPAVRHGLRHRIREIWVVDGIPVMGAQIKHGEAAIAQFLDEQLLQFEARMVAGDRNGVGHGDWPPLSE